jgi:hypothetical protein
MRSKGGNCERQKRKFSAASFTDRRWEKCTIGGGVVEDDAPRAGTQENRLPTGML